MGLKEDIGVGSNIARQMIADHNKGAIYKEGVKAVGEEHTPRFLKRGCLPIAIGTIIGVYGQIVSHATEHIIPTITAGLILSGFGRILQKISHK